MNLPRIRQISAAMGNVSNKSIKMQTEILYRCINYKITGNKCQSKSNIK